jgi:hypothetical protein
MQVELQVWADTLKRERDVYRDKHDCLNAKHQCLRKFWAERKKWPLLWMHSWVRSATQR